MAAAGVSKDTFYRWLNQGSAHRKDRASGAKLTQDKARLADFSDVIEKATAEAELGDLATIKQASASNWQAAAWRLERRHPTKYGNRMRTEVSGPDGGPIVQEVKTDMDLSKLTVDELKAYRAILAKGMGK